MNYIRFISKRYLFSKSGNNAINVIVKIASFGVLIVSAAFIIVLSGFSGIRTFNLNLIKMTDPDIKITAKKGKFFTFTEELSDFLKKDPAVKAYTKCAEEKVFVLYQKKQKIAKLKGVDRNFNHVVPIDSTLIAGQMPQPGSNELLLGVSLANDLSYMLSGNTYDFIQLLVPKPGKGLITDPRKAFKAQNFLPVGIYQTTPDHDQIYLYTSLKAAQDLLDMAPDQISSVAIAIKQPEQMTDFQKRLQYKFGESLNIRNRQQLNKLLYKMLNTENLMVYFIFTLILLLALFNIIGTIIMIIIDKSQNIETLRILGLTPAEVKQIFMIQGFSMTLMSGLAGMILGLILVGFQQLFPYLYIPQTNMPYPVEFRWTNVLWVVLTIIFMAGFATYIALLKLDRDKSL